MVRISILIPMPGSRFDLSYYIEQHMPRSIELLSAHPVFASLGREGHCRRRAEFTPAYAAMCHFLFESTEASWPHSSCTPELQGDIPNYTDVSPVIQINEVLISK